MRNADREVTEDLLDSGLGGDDEGVVEAVDEPDLNKGCVGWGRWEGATSREDDFGDGGGEGGRG